MSACSRRSPIVRVFAEEPDRFMPDPSPPSRPIRDERFTLFLGPTPWLTIVSAVRADADDVESLVGEIRDLAAAAGHRRVG